MADSISTAKPNLRTMTEYLSTIKTEELLEEIKDSITEASKGMTDSGIVNLIEIVITSLQDEKEDFERNLD